MKKKIFALGVLLTSTTLLGGGSVFAAQAGTTPVPAQGQTGVTATFTAPTVINPLPPGGTDPVVPGGPTGTFGLAYVPKGMSFADDLSTGAMSIQAKDAAGTSAYGTTHVGVKDTTFNTKGWNLTAQLNWTGSAVAGAEIQMTPGTVKENQNDGSTPFNPVSDLVTPGVGSGAFIVPGSAFKINSTAATSVLKANDGNVYTGTYDLELSNISLEIPNGSVVSAGNYSGNIDWNLSLNP